MEWAIAAAITLISGAIWLGYANRVEDAQEKIRAEQECKRELEREATDWDPHLRSNCHAAGKTTS